MGEKAEEEIGEISLGIKEEIEEIYARALKVGGKVGKIEEALPSKKEVKDIFEFISSPYLLPKDHPIPFNVTCSLLDWVKNNRQNIFLYYRIEEGVENLKKELSK